MERETSLEERERHNLEKNEEMNERRERLGQEPIEYVSEADEEKKRQERIAQGSESEPEPESEPTTAPAPEPTTAPAPEPTTAPAHAPAPAPAPPSAPAA